MYFSVFLHSKDTANCDFYNWLAIKKPAELTTGFVFLWRTRTLPIRTASEIEAHIRIYPVQPLYLYQKHAQKATELHLLGMTYKQITKALNVSRCVIKKALRYYKSMNKERS